jgi:carboxyl-terminal processing protease
MRGTMTALIAMACALAAPAAGQPTPSPPSDYLPVFDRLWSTVNDNFYDPRMNGVDWRAVGARYRPEAATVRTDADFHALGTRMLKELKVSHLYLRAPRPQPAATPSSVATGVLPIRSQMIGDDRVVLEVREGGAEFKVGDRILPNTPAPGAPGAFASLEAEGCDGLQRTVRFSFASRAPVQQWRTLTSPGGERIGYHRLDRFNPGMIPDMDQAMAAFADTDGLVIDLRNNNGGDSSALHLQNYFVEGSRPAMIIWSRGALQRLGRMPTPAEALTARKVLGGERFFNVVKGMILGGGKAAAWTEGRGAAGYRKPVVVLIGPGTGSAAEGFAWGMKLTTPARLIGRTTAGELLSSENYDLPRGWRVTLPNYGLWGPDGVSYADRPVEPHQAVTWTREALCKGGDPDMASALRHHDETD